MTRKRLTAVLAAAALTPTVALAQPGTPGDMQGSALLASCRTGEPACGAYLQGVVDMMIARQGACGAPRYDRDQLRSAYLRWAESDTYFRDKHMVAGAERAMSLAWPCKVSPPR